MANDLDAVLEAAEEEEEEIVTEPEVPVSKVRKDVDYIDINYATKTMSVPTYYRVMGVAGDVESRRIWFRVKDLSDEMDMSESALEVIYWNKAKESGRYAVLDAFEEDGIVYFSFLPPYSLTSQSGAVNIALVAHMDDKVWRISPASLTVSTFPDINYVEPTDPKYDIINQLLIQMVALNNDTMDNTERIENLEFQSAKFFDHLETEDGQLYAYNNGVLVEGPIEVGSGGSGGGGGGGGGGGSSTNDAVLTVSDQTGWISKSISEGGSVTLQFFATSLENEQSTGNLRVQVTINGVQVMDMDKPQGVITVDPGPYCAVGTNTVRIVISDSYSNYKSFLKSIKVVVQNLSTTFDDSSPVSGGVYWPFVATGTGDKTMHFIMDGVEIDTMVVGTSGRQSTYYIPEQDHGVHTFVAYFTTIIDGNTVSSPVITNHITWVAEGNLDDVVAIYESDDSCSLYENVITTYSVYSPSSLTQSVTLYVDDVEITTIVVDRTKQTWSWKAESEGEHILKVVAGMAEQTRKITVNPISLNASLTTEDMVLNFSPYGRSNSESTPAQWSYGDYSMTFNNFTFGEGDGWIINDAGEYVLRIANGATAEINYFPFANDWRTTGKTMEFDITTSDVRDYETPIIQSMNDGRGLKITPREAMLASEQSVINLSYKDDYRWRISLVAQKSAKNRLIYIYVDGVLSQIIQYPTNDDFEQLVPQKLSFGSTECVVDIHNIIIYDNDLSDEQILGNWIMNRTSDATTMLELDTRNDVLNSNDEIDINKLPSDLPVLIIDGELPPAKGTKKIIAGSYTDPEPGKSFSYWGAEADVQGTSSAGYPVKNLKISFKKGFALEE